jgi:NTE family protein
MHRNGDLPPAEAYATLPQFVAASMRIVADSTDPKEAARRIATMPPLGNRLPPAAARRAAVAALLPRQQWPQQRLLVTAVDADTGQRVAFDAGSGVELIDAVTASGALPGIYPLVAINGRRYADGGVHSLYHADLATGNEKVVVLSAMPLNAHLRRSFDTETAALHPATVHLVVADDASLRAMGPDPAAIDTAPAALEAGTAQARREAGTLRRVWDG